MRRAPHVGLAGLLSLLLLGAGVGLVTPASAAPKPGAPCATVGKKVTTTQWIFTCTKKKDGRKVWVRKPRPAPGPSPTPTPSPSPSPSNDAEIASLQFPATRGTVPPPPADAGGQGPWSTGMAVSAGSGSAVFPAATSIIDQAGVPSLLALPDGRLLAYFVSWAQGNVMAVGIRDLAGEWAFYRVSVEGFRTDVGGANGVDPSAVLMADGSIRLFWMQPVARRAARRSTQPRQHPDRRSVCASSLTPGRALTAARWSTTRRSPAAATSG